MKKEKNNKTKEKDDEYKLSIKEAQERIEKFMKGKVN